MYVKATKLKLKKVNKYIYKKINNKSNKPCKLIVTSKKNK